MNDWLVIPAILLLMVGSLVGVVVWSRWARTWRDPTYDELVDQLNTDLAEFHDQLMAALGIPALVERLNAILERLNHDRN